MTYHLSFEDIAASALSYIMQRNDRRSVSFSEIKLYCHFLSKIVEGRTGNRVEVDLNEDNIADFLEEYCDLFSDATVNGRDGIRARNGVTRHSLMVEFQGYLPPCVLDAIETLDRNVITGEEYLI